MKKIVVLLFVIFVFVSSAAADDTGDVKKLLKPKLDLVITILKNKKISKKERNTKIIEIVDTVFDLSKMAKLTLGRKYWPGLSKEQKKEFAHIFAARLKESYLDKLNIYTDEKLFYRESKFVKKKVHFLTELISDNNKISMLYKFYKSKKKGWLIYDVEVQGVSLISTYRSQFDQVLRKQTIKDLILKLKNPEN